VSEVRGSESVSAMGSQSVLGLEWVLAPGSQLESRLLLELGSGLVPR
jgi:hypothetical protein